MPVEVYYRVPAEDMKTELDVLVPRRISFKGFSFFEQIGTAEHEGAFVMNPYQYFAFRKHAAEVHGQFRELTENRGELERLNLIVSFNLIRHGYDPMVYPNPDMKNGTVKPSGAFPVLSFKRWKNGGIFCLNEIDREIGLPLDVRDKVRKEDLDYVLSFPRRNDSVEGVRIGDYYFAPVFRNGSKGVATRRLELHHHHSLCRSDLGVRVCLLATEKNLERVGRGFVVSK